MPLHKLKMTGLVSQGQEAGWRPPCEAQAAPFVPAAQVCPTPLVLPSELMNSAGSKPLGLATSACAAFHNQLIKPTRVVTPMQVLVYEARRQLWEKTKEIFLSEPPSLPQCGSL